MSQNFCEQSLVNIIKQHGGHNTGPYSVQNLLFCWDVDLTLADTMATDISAARQALFRELFVRMNDGMIIMTGRSSDSVEKTLAGEYPGSFEHHSAMRIEQGGDIIALAPSVSMQAVGEEAKRYIQGVINKERLGLRIAQTPDEVRSAEGKFPLVYPEVKNYAVALVHSLGHGHVTHNREIFKRAAAHTIEALGLKATHDVAIGNDAIEIVPNGLSADSPARQILHHEQVIRLGRKGLNKGQGLHNFLSLDAYKNSSTWVIGDSGTDGRAMNKAYKYYNGGGIWVLNGKTVPDEFSQAVGGRTIENFMRTWDAIEEAVNFLRARQKVYVVAPTASPTP